MSPAQTTAPGARPALLEAHRLTCHRGGRVLFRNLDLSIAAGEILEIHGPNGSGKTTLLRLLCAITHPESGELRWKGRPPGEERSGFLAAIAYLGHQDGIKLALTARENLQAAARLAGGSDPDAALARFGLGAVADTPARALSAGQRRRVALARLLLRDAALWVLDEPFTALDDEGTALMQSLLARQADGGGAVALSTHRPLALGVAGHRRLELGR